MGNDFREAAALISEALVCGVHHWTQIWGDPILIGSVFMLCYGAAATFLLYTARRLQGRERRLYIFLGIIFLFQLINVHLDAHALILTFSRCLARATEWSGNRQRLQLIGMLVAAGLVLAFFVLMLASFRGAIWKNFLIIFGVTVSLSVTLIKGMNYSPVMEFLNAPVWPSRWADVIELAGISIAFIATLLRDRATRAHMD